MLFAWLQSKTNAFHDPRSSLETENALGRV
jgi:hypothetical protein